MLSTLILSFTQYVLKLNSIAPPCDKKHQVQGEHKLITNLGQTQWFSISVRCSSLQVLSMEESQTPLLYSRSSALVTHTGPTLQAHTASAKNQALLMQVSTYLCLS